MKRLAAFAVLALAGCGAAPKPYVPPEGPVNEAAFMTDEIYGVRHRGSGAICPGSIGGVNRTRAAVNTDGARYDWCSYTDRSHPEAFNIRIERKPGEAVDAGIAALKASLLPDPDTWTETKADMTERQATGATWSKAGSATSHALWLSPAGDWRVSLYASYPEAKRAEIVAAANDYFRKLRAPR